ncbi:SGNH/GDSL hydrolase family protein [Streptomyces halobius]|uniref:SGNH/GDSL hydrolase family protein n=1 Tax=Streptomyces halobius TaxID=2879846 RepID=A0ABY4MDF6_9ACTN|nr:SGNH/GDSL hydrolase family protein [Streptomyces halobius]UQA95809.1 SGNH/GDSL hydrolase family protein [Streptomyces halobius]
MSRSRMPTTARLTLAGAAALAMAGAALAPPSPARADPAGRPEYVALGDSYSAGVFVRRWDEQDGCGRSYRNYPHQVAERLGYALKDVTCGGAEVGDGVLQRQPASKVYGPPTTPPKGGWSARPAQVDALSSGTRVVTVSVGGNSIGFGSILAKCVAEGSSSSQPAPCQDYFTSGDGAQWLKKRRDQLDRDLGHMMDVIRGRAPNAKVAVVGYPAIAAKSAGCDFLNWKQLGTIKKADISWIDRFERDVNALLEKHATDHDADYVDTYGPSAAHGVCESGGAKWMYGIRDDLTGDGDQADKPSEKCRKIPGTAEACTLVHPNARGLDNQARQVIRALASGG